MSNMNNQEYKCPRCHNILPLSNKALHDLRCPGNNQNNQSNSLALIQSSNSNNNRNNNFNQNYYNNMNNVISTNINSTMNPDGTRTQIKTETYRNGYQRITKTKYNQNNQVISNQSTIQNINDINNNNSNSNVNIQTTTHPNGNVTITKTEITPNGGIRTMSITKDRNGNIINQSVNSSGGNGFNNIMFNNNMNNMNNMNNYNNSMTNFQNNMNNFNNSMNNFQNNMNMFNMGMNNMMNNMFMNMNNMNNMDMNNGVERDILDTLEASKLNDISHLEEDKKNCIICLEDFKTGDEVIYLPCFHVFHKDCILEWFRGHDYCPICKFKLNRENMN